MIESEILAEEGAHEVGRQAAEQTMEPAYMHNLRGYPLLCAGKRPFILPIILGVCIAYILNPLVGLVPGKVSKRVYFFYATAVTISPSEGGTGRGDE